MKRLLLDRARAEASNAELIAHLRLTAEKMRREIYGPRSEHKARLLEQMELQLLRLPRTISPPRRRQQRHAGSRLHVQEAFAQAMPRTSAARPDHRAGSDRVRILGSTTLGKLGEDITETLEVVPRSRKVVQYVREKFSCRAL